MAFVHDAVGKQVSTGSAVGEPTPEILVIAFHDQQWQVRYDFDVPVTQLIFARSPDSSRLQSWLPDQGFELISSEQGDVARRKDHGAFRTVRFRMDAVYRMLPKDYAPFSPFGDGGMLFHTGRLFACVNVCADDAVWRTQFWASPQDNIVVNGEAKQGEARWTDRGDGRVVYVGAGRPKESKDVVAVLDEVLPNEIRDQLLTRLPQFMHLFSSRMGVLPFRPMLFASYDLSHANGWGRQGGTLPGQVFTHFYGAQWSVEMTKPEFGDDLAWHFAHEAAHLYQRQVFSGAGDAWIHEGSAEALAALALRSLHLSMEEFIDTRIARAREKCQEQLGDQAIVDATRNGAFDIAYSCGLLVNLAVDHAIRSNTQNDGLYAVWREYLRSVRDGLAPGESAYLDAISKIGNAEIALWVRNQLRVRRPVFE